MPGRDEPGSVDGGDVDEADGGDAEESDGGDADDGDEGSEEPVVRRYEPGDRDAVLRIHDEAMRAAGTDPTDIPDVDDLERVAAAYIDPGGEFLVVELDGEVVAMGGLAVDGDDLAPGEGELFRIAVDPDHQREGHGSRVLAGLEAAARERGLDRIVLTTARRQTAATEFYPAHGYERTGRERVDDYELLRFAKSLD